MRIVRSDGYLHGRILPRSDDTMSKNTSNGSDAVDGSWFLEAIGAKPKQPSPSEAVAELTAENTLIDTPATEPAPPPVSVVEMSFDGNPGTSTSSFHPVPVLPTPPDLEHPAPSPDPTPSAPEPSEMTGAVAPPMATSPTTTSAVDETQLSSALRSRRNFRWPIVITLVVLIAAVGVAAWWLPQSVEQEALATRQDYYDTAAAVRNYLPETQGGLDAITNPESDAEAVAGAVPVVAELDRRAFDLETVTAEPLPSTLPFVPAGQIDALVPLRNSGAILGASASELAKQLGTAYIYRTSIPLLLDTGPLPVTASTQEVNDISVRLAASLAQDAGIVADLPDDPAFADIRTEAIAAVDRYGAWQDEYLAALTGEDPDAAQRLVSEMEILRSDLVVVNTDDLLAFRTDADQWIVRLAGELEAYLADLTRS
jgi:hypothetical protein